MAETSATFDQLIDVWIERPAAEAGYRRISRPTLWVRRLPDGTRTLFQVYRRAASPLEDEITFTVEWAAWTPAFARSVSRAKHPRPLTSSALLAARLPFPLVPPHDVWWTVRGKRVVEEAIKPRPVTWPPSDDDLLPTTLRKIAIPMLSKIKDAKTAAAACTTWRASGVEPSVHHDGLSR